MRLYVASKYAIKQPKQRVPFWQAIIKGKDRGQVTKIGVGGHADYPSTRYAPHLSFVSASGSGCESGGSPMADSRFSVIRQNCPTILAFS